MPPVAVVTGAFGNIGRSAAMVLRERGWTVRTLTRRRPAADDPPFESFPLLFAPDALAPALRGADALVNTYWVRMPEHGATFEQAVDNSRLLIDAAVAAGVARIVQVSVSNRRGVGACLAARARRPARAALHQRPRRPARNPLSGVHSLPGLALGRATYQGRRAWNAVR